MLEFEKISPEKLAYDTPTNPMLNFLHKYYNLSSFIPQTNNFLIFKEFYTDNNKKTEDKNNVLIKGRLNSHRNISKTSFSNNITKNSMTTNSNLSSNLDSSTNVGKIANLGRDLVCKIILIKDSNSLQQIQTRNSNSSNGSLLQNLNSFDGQKNENTNFQNYNNNIIPQNNFSQYRKIESSNVYTNSLQNKINQKTDSIHSAVPRSTNFAERKNFALYYLSDLNNSIHLNKSTTISEKPENSFQNKFQFSPIKESISAHEKYFQERMNLNKKDTEMTIERIRDLENKLNPKKTEFYEFNKRNEYSTIHDKRQTKQNLLQYLQHSDGVFDRSVELKPIFPIYK